MNDPPQVLLLDTNAYLRLAPTFPALLSTTFGDSPRFTLYILPDLNSELRQSARLRARFEWIVRAESAQERATKLLRLKRTEVSAADEAFSYLADQAEERQLSVSRVDLKTLATAFAKGICVVSDDRGMATLGTEFDIAVWPVLRLLKLMLDRGRTDLDTIRQALEYWQHENDLPCGLADLRRVYREYFGSDCPL